MGKRTSLFINRGIPEDDLNNSRSGSFLWQRLLCSFLALILLAVTGCQEEASEIDTTPEPKPLDMTFPEPTFSGDRTLDTLFTVDFDDDGRREYVVTSIEPNGTLPGNARADLIEIYRFDTGSASWKVIIADTLLWSTRYDLAELTGDRASELVIETFGGGNDPTSSKGMTIYTGHGNNIRLLREQLDGDPELKRVEGSKEPVMLLHSEFWPEFVPHVQATVYVSDLIGFADGIARSVRKDHLPFFQQEAEERLANFKEVLKKTPPRDTVDSDMFESEGTDLYVAAAETIIALNEARNTRELRTFWHGQEETLRRLLSEGEFDVLSELYADKIMGQ